MTKEQKSKIGNVSISVLIMMLFAFGGWLTNVKADRSELKKVEEKTDRNCEKIERNSEFNHRLEKVLIRVETLLDERTKRETNDKY